MKQFSLSLFLAVLMLFVGCSRRNSGIPVTAILKKEIRGQVLDFEKPDADLMKRFTSEAKADTVHFKDGSFALATKNREFMDSILLPAVERRRTNLEKLSHRDLISDLA